MGKAKKLRKSSHKKRRQPHGSSAAEQEKQKEHLNQQDLAAGINSLSASTREATCVALASIFSSQSLQYDTRQQQNILLKLRKDGVLKQLIPTLLDKNTNVRLHALGALRNITIAGGVQLCEYLVNLDVVSPLVHLMVENMNFTSFKSNPKFTNDLLEQVVALWINLAEACPEAVALFSQNPSVVQAFLCCFDAEIAYETLQLEASKLFLIVTDSNPEFYSHCSSNHVSKWLEIATSSNCNMLLRLNLAGGLLNMPLDASMFNQLLPIVQSGLESTESNIRANVAGVIEADKVLQENAQEVNIQVTEDEKMQQEIEQQNEKIRHAQQVRAAWKSQVQIGLVAMEIVVNLLSPQDESQQAAEDEEEWDTDDEDGMNQMALATSGASSPASTLEHANALVHHAAFPTLLTQIQSLFNFCYQKMEAQSMEMIGDYLRLGNRACNCFQNLLSVLPSSSPVISSVVQALYQTYHVIQRLQSQEAQGFQLESSINLEIAITAAFGSIFHRLDDPAVQALLLTQYGSEIDALITHFQSGQVKNVESQMNIVGIFGEIARHCSNPTQQQMIGNLLVQVLHDQSIVIVMEALDIIFDVYGQDDATTEALYQSLDLASHLQQVQAHLQQLLKTERKTLGSDVVAQVKEIRLNLIRFIKYKESN